jgi:hypothetical protein
MACSAIQQVDTVGPELRRPVAPLSAPGGFAEAALLLGEDRKLHPGPRQEVVFFDHPSGYTRIEAAMRWQAQQRDAERRRE